MRGFQIGPFRVHKAGNPGPSHADVALQRHTQKRLSSLDSDNDPCIPSCMFAACVVRPAEIPSGNTKSSSRGGPPPDTSEAFCRTDFLLPSHARLDVIERRRSDTRDQRETDTVWPATCVKRAFCDQGKIRTDTQFAGFGFTSRLWPTLH